MQDYSHFEPEELATDASFQRWQLVNDPADDAFWNEWLLRNPDKDELVEKAAYLLTTLNSTYERRISEQAQVSDGEVRAEIRQLRQAIQENSNSRVKWFTFTPIQYGVAASFLILAGLLGWHTFHPASSKQAVTYQNLIATAAGPLSEVINTTNKPLQIDLPDESTVLLYPKSRVSYQKRFSGIKREVYLVGKAHFSVTKNPSKPFYVYANDLVTKVLGTSFTVQAYEGERQIKVVVRTGKVSVFTQNKVDPNNQKEPYKPAGTVLTPNQQVVFSPTETSLVKTLVALPVLLEPVAQKPTFSFKRAPIADVFSALNQAYGIPIRFDAERMRTCYLTASFSDEPLFEKLDLICRTVNASYEQVDGTISINSKGCDESVSR